MDGVLMYEWIILLTDLVVGGLFLGLGGNLGSFLNVVVHRLPRGESVVHGGSHCPSCGSAIRWHDNVPVLGWLLLGGRCRDCSVPISARYPLVEAAGAILIGGVAAAELLSGGRTLPGTGFGTVRPGADNLLLRPDPLLVTVAIFHAWLLFNLLLGAALEADGQAIPQRWQRVALGVTVVASLVWSALLPVGIGFEGPAWMGQGPARGMVIAVCGALCGAVVGAPLGGAFRQGMILVGATLGWQATVAIALVRPVVGWLRSQVAALIPPAPPPHTLDGAGWTAGPVDGAETIQTTGAAFPADSPSLSESDEVSVFDPGPQPAATDPDSFAPRRCLVRLTGTLFRQLSRRDLRCGDLLVSTAVLLMAWRWLWLSTKG
jgi:leader peptidase (prepilin peptidase)/N-methyltransferase